MSRWILAVVAGGALLGAPVFGQADAKVGELEAGAKAQPDKRVGDPYPLDTCAHAGKKLGSMGDPVVRVYDGREVRFCCGSCPPRFEKDLAAGLAKVDAKIIEDQRPIYPLATSIVTGKDLPEKPFELVYGNRLIRLHDEGERAAFLADGPRHLEGLNKAVIEKRGPDYPLKTCIVSGEALDRMGKPRDVVVGGRLVRLCCADCKKDLEKDPAKFIARVDEARKAAGARPEKK
jgi:hypothetical protein